MIQLEAIDINLIGFSGGDNNGTIQIDETCILPIEIASFEGHHENAVNILDWSTPDAHNTERFIVERSPDGMNFEDLGEVKVEEYVGGQSGGAPTQANIHAYRYLDKDPFQGHNYYRLRNIDLNGDYSHSNVINIFVLRTGLDILEIWPNPATSEIHIEVLAPADGNYSLQVVDMYGKAVIESDEELVMGKNTLTYDLNSLSVGMYIVELKHLFSNRKSHGKFVKW